MYPEIKYMIKHIFLLITIISLSYPIFGQELDNSLLKQNRDTLQLHFRFNSSIIDKNHLSNNKTLEHIKSIFFRE